MEKKDLPASEVEGQIGEIRLIPLSPKCGRYRNCDLFANNDFVLGEWLTVCFDIIWYQIIEDSKAGKINTLFYT